MIMTTPWASLIILLAAFAMPVVADDVNELIQDLKDPIPTI
jgi:hypothetical protein